MKIIFHGAAKEIGRSCIEVKSDNARILLDCGLKFSDKGTEYPIGFKTLKDIDAVLLTHAHLDHSGGLPIFDHNGLHCPIYATKMTKMLAKILLEDSFKIGRIHHPNVGYEEQDIKDAIKCMERVKYEETGMIKDIQYEFFDAGHIPGSSTIFLRNEDTSILYTGDINLIDTQLLKAADLKLPEVDIFITECTYGDRDHPPRQSVENQFVKAVVDVIQRGGSCIIPVFAVGRAQEILLLLSDQDFKVPIFIDGMAVKVTDLFLNYPNFVKDPEKLEQAMKNAFPVRDWHQRKKIMDHPGIFITTSGMLTGGPVVEYIKRLHKDPKNAILMTGFQGEHTNGALLLKTGTLYIDGWKLKAKCEVKQFDFSAHSGLAQLKFMVKHLKPKKLILQHGDPKAIENMAQWAKSMGYETIIAELNKPIDVTPLTI